MDGPALNFRIGGDSSAFEQAVSEARKEAQALNRTVTTGFGGSRRAGREFVQAANDSKAGFMKMTGAAKLTSNQMLNLTRQGNDVITMLAMGAAPMQVFTSQAGQVYDALSSGPGGLTGGLKGLGSGLLRVATRFWPVTAALAVISGGLLGMQHQINATSKTTVSFGNVAKATFEVVRNAIWAQLKPAFDAISPWAAAAWNGVVTVVKTVGNTVIGLGAAAVEGFKAAWSTLPGALAQIADRAGWALFDRLRHWINKTIGEAQTVINWVNKQAGTHFAKPAMIPWQAPPKMDAAGEAGLDKMKNAIKGAFSTDYLGEFYDAIKKQAIELAKAGAAGDKAGKKIGGAAKKAIDPWKGLRDITDKTAKKLEQASKSMGQTWGSALRGILDGTMKWKDTLMSIGRSILKYFDQMSVAKRGSGLFGGGLFGGIMKGLLGFAKGGVFDDGLTRFATGGVFSSSILSQPTIFRFANGIGMAGEAGPEAIMPLRRGRDGRLGVSAANGNAPSVVYAPVYRIDARGADQAAVTRMKNALDQHIKSHGKIVTRDLHAPRVRKTRPT